MALDIRQKYEVETEKVESSPGCWSTLEVSIFRIFGKGNKSKIGSYKRNYHTLFNTFVPFTLNNNDYALYSPDYTCTRIMELPSCKDIGGESPCENGFCPVDFHVPLIRRAVFPSSEDKSRTLDCWLADDACFNKDELKGALMLDPPQSARFGFVAGCLWADDSSWKIQYLDLSKAPQGIIKREEKFDYIQLPRNMKLKEAIDMSNWEPTSQIVSITNSSNFHLKHQPFK